MNEEEYQAWLKDVVSFAKDDAVANTLEVMKFVEHRDEAHPHISSFLPFWCAIAGHSAYSAFRYGT